MGKNGDPANDVAHHLGRHHAKRLGALFPAFKVAPVQQHFEAAALVAGSLPLRRFCIDIGAAFIKGTAAHLPNADIAFDKFHAVKIINDAVDLVRRAEQKDRPELKRLV